MYNEQPRLFHQWIFASLTDSLRNISNTYAASQSPDLNPTEAIDGSVPDAWGVLGVPPMHPSGFVQVWIRELVASTFVPMIYYHCASALHKENSSHSFLCAVGFDRSQVFLF